MCQKCELFDKNFKISDLDLAIKASKYSLSQVNTSYGLVRHEFLEFLIRVSLDKYYRSGYCKSEVDAVKMLFENHFIKHFKFYDRDLWRYNRYFNQECEEVILENKELLKKLFDMYSGKKAKPGEKKYMRLDDFISLCQLYGFQNNTFNLRQVTLSFHMALYTHIDEINTTSHMEASRLEFIEALARVADYYQSQDPEKEMLGNIYSDISLHKKLYEMFDSFPTDKKKYQVINT